MIATEYRNATTQKEADQLGCRGINPTVSLMPSVLREFGADGAGATLSVRVCVGVATTATNPTITVTTTTHCHHHHTR